MSSKVQLYFKVQLVVVPRLPIEELMKVNFRRLTTSHHGDLWPPVSMAKIEPEMIRMEQPLQHYDREHAQVKPREECSTAIQWNCYSKNGIWSYQSLTRWGSGKAASIGSRSEPCTENEGGWEDVFITRTEQWGTKPPINSYFHFDKQN